MLGHTRRPPACVTSPCKSWRQRGQSVSGECTGSSESRLSRKQKRMSKVLLIIFFFSINWSFFSQEQEVCQIEVSSGVKKLFDKGKNYKKYDYSSKKLNLKNPSSAYLLKKLKSPIIISAIENYVSVSVF